MMNNDWIAQAIEVFAKTKYCPREQDVTSLAEAMALVAEGGLQALNDRLMQANRKIFDTIAELNVAVMLLRHTRGAAIEYEPSDYGPRPVDFRITSEETTLNLQMKRFGELERDNRRSAVYDRIKEGAAGIHVRKLFSVSLSEEFSEEDIPSLLRFLGDSATEAKDGDEHEFKGKDSVLATVDFWTPRSTPLDHLTLGSGSDASAVNITGLAAGQLRASLRKAAGAFTRPVDAKNLNLLLAESDKHHEIDVCEACFGTEEEVFGANGQHAWHRLGDGVFADDEIAKHVAGLIVLRRAERAKPVTAYKATLLVNEPHIRWADEITRAFPVGNVMRYNMRP